MLNHQGNILQVLEGPCVDGSKRYDFIINSQALWGRNIKYLTTENKTTLKYPKQTLSKYPCQCCKKNLFMF